MARTQTLTIQEAHWSAEIAELVGRAVQHASVDDVHAQWAAGAAHVFTVADDDWNMVAAFVLRTDDLAAGAEGVIVAAAGGADGVSLTDAVLPAIERIFNGCKSVRIHTARPGLIKLLTARHGYTLTECVLKKDMGNGQ